jgi:hypothetical protein
MLNASQYTIWLRESQSGGVREKLKVQIPGGDKPNSMFFDERVPRIRDDGGNIIPWMTRGGYQVYVTQRSVVIEGTWRGECFLEIEVIK